MSTAETSYQPVRGPKAHSDQWKALRVYDPVRVERPVVFGASEAAAATGMSPYGQPLDLFLRKRGEIAELEDNDRMRMGRKLEPVVLSEYAEREQVGVFTQLDMHFHPELTYIGATPDAQRDDDRRIVEAKTTSWRMLDKDAIDPSKFGEEGTDQVPVDYMMQSQQLCLVFGCDVVDVPVLFDGATYRLYRVERNEDLIAHLIQCERELAERIVNNDPPEPHWEHHDTRRLLREMYGIEKGKVVELDDSYRELWLRYQALGEEVKKAEADRTALRNMILAEMRDANVARFNADFELSRTRIKETTFTTTRSAYDRLSQRKVK